MAKTPALKRNIILVVGAPKTLEMTKRIVGFGKHRKTRYRYAILMSQGKAPSAEDKEIFSLFDIILTCNFERGYIKGIIGLPANLFYGAGIPACIVVVDKEGAENRQGIFMIDASKGFIKDGSKNRLREMDIHQIVDVRVEWLAFKIGIQGSPTSPGTGRSIRWPES